MNKWWGYVHVDGGIHVKRYNDMEDIREAEGSPFVDHVFRVFDANSRTEALRCCKWRLQNG